jgi:hypothetical protein
MFVFTWLPYAFICIYRTLWGASNLTRFQMTLPAMFAKSSLTWPPMFFLAFNKRIQKAFFALIYLKRDDIAGTI